MSKIPDYNDGVKDERSRCVTVCEYWKRPAYIATHFGTLDDYGMSVLQKVVALIESDIQSGNQPK